MGALKVGRGTEPDVDVGPADRRRASASKVAELVERRRRARRASRCSAASSRGRPRLLLRADRARRRARRRARCSSEEIFGPVAPVATFATEEQAIAAANDTEYGLVAYVYTRDLDRALRVCEGLETGMVGLNQGVVSNPAAPFGGVKQSGFGREGGFEGIEEYLETKYVAIAV